MKCRREPEARPRHELALRWALIHHIGIGCTSLIEGFFLAASALALVNQSHYLTLEIPFTF